ncbi:hypothetical protein GCM10010174_63950 [Kutzneria viridogrisea]
MDRVVTGRAAAVLCGLVVAGVLTGCGGETARPVAQTTTTGTTQPTGTTTGPSTTTGTAAHELTGHAKELVDKARQQGRKTVVLLIAAEPGHTQEVADALPKLGVTVHAADASVSYVRATAPLDVVPQVAAMAGVQKLDVDEELGNADPTP